MTLKINNTFPFKKKTKKLKQNVPLPKSGVEGLGGGSPLSSQPFNIQLSLTSLNQHRLVVMPSSPGEQD